ncbi:HD domain-containing protein [Candidatus Micrarchaeota archaeon]|nr:HD domain-containing protein [Candidatus Micrarchaeota archaeon]
MIALFACLLLSSVAGAATVSFEKRTLEKELKFLNSKVTGFRGDFASAVGASLYTQSISPDTYAYQRRLVSIFFFCTQRGVPVKEVANFDRNNEEDCISKYWQTYSSPILKGERGQMHDQVREEYKHPTNPAIRALTNLQVDDAKAYETLLLKYASENRNDGEAEAIYQRVALKYLQPAAASLTWDGLSDNDKLALKILARCINGRGTLTLSAIFAGTSSSDPAKIKKGVTACLGDAPNTQYTLLRVAVRRPPFQSIIHSAANDKSAKAAITAKAKELQSLQEKKERALSTPTSSFHKLDSFGKAVLLQKLASNRAANIINREKRIAFINNVGLGLTKCGLGFAGGMVSGQNLAVMGALGVVTFVNPTTGVVLGILMAAYTTYASSEELAQLESLPLTDRTEKICSAAVNLLMVYGGVKGGLKVRKAASVKKTAAILAELEPETQTAAPATSRGKVLRTKTSTTAKKSGAKGFYADVMSFFTNEGKINILNLRKTCGQCGKAGVAAVAGKLAEFVKAYDSPRNANFNAKAVRRLNEMLPRLKTDLRKKVLAVLEALGEEEFKFEKDLATPKHVGKGCGETGNCGAFTLSHSLGVGELVLEGMSKLDGAQLLKLGQELGVKGLKTAADAQKHRGEIAAKAWVAAVIHDAGKIQFPDYVLKRGSLSKAERGILNTHSALGYTTLKKLGFTHEEALAALKHHNPKGSVLGELVYVADAYHAMRFDRPYRTKTLDLNTIMAEATKRVSDSLKPLFTQMVNEWYNVFKPTD